MSEFRTGNAADIEAAVGVWRRAVEATHAFLSGEDIAGLEPEVRAGLGVMEFWVAEEDGTVVGFMGMSGDMIEALFVEPAWRGKGVGSGFIGLARKLRGKEAVLRVDVNEQNPEATAFYLAKGFVRIGRSDTDSAGRPWPLLHLELAPAREE